jgi:hypothetical protein
VFLSLYFYFAVKWALLLRKYLLDKLAGRAATFPFSFPVVRSWAYVILVIGFGILAGSLVLKDFSRISAARVAAASRVLMMADYQLFGVYLPFWLQRLNVLPWLGQLLIDSYRHLWLFVGLVFFALLVARRDLLRKFVLAFFLVGFLSLPFWHRWPAISPNWMYRKNILHVSLANLPARESLQAKVSPGLQFYFTQLEQRWVDPTNLTFAVTNFPSMHAAWGLIVAYFAFRLWKKSALLLVPWTTLNAVAAIYVLEHYGVDVVLGLGLAIGVIALVQWLLRWESRYYGGSWQPFLGPDILAKDARTLAKRFQNWWRVRRRLEKLG